MIRQKYVKNSQHLKEELFSGLCQEIVTPSVFLIWSVLNFILKVIFPPRDIIAGYLLAARVQLELGFKFKNCEDDM